MSSVYDENYEKIIEGREWEGGRASDRAHLVLKFKPESEKGKKV